MGSTGDSYDNALAEALNSLYKAELIDNEARPGYAGPWRDRRGRGACLIVCVSVFCLKGLMHDE